MLVPACDPLELRSMYQRVEGHHSHKYILPIFGHEFKQFIEILESNLVQSFQIRKIAMVRVD